MIFKKKTNIEGVNSGLTIGDRIIFYTTRDFK